MLLFATSVHASLSDGVCIRLLCSEYLIFPNLVHRKLLPNLGQLWERLTSVHNVSSVSQFSVWRYFNQEHDIPGKKPKKNSYTTMWESSKCCNPLKWSQIKQWTCLLHFAWGLVGERASSFCTSSINVCRSKLGNKSLRDCYRPGITGVEILLKIRKI